MKSKVGFLVLFLGCIICLNYTVESKCSSGCALASASFYVWYGSNLTHVSKVMQTDSEKILSYNKGRVHNKESVHDFMRVNVPFRCDCIGGEFLGHVFNYSVHPGDNYDVIASNAFSNLTTPQWLQKFNARYTPKNFPENNAWLNVTVNCSCGNASISKDYGVFITYPLKSTDSLDSIANETKLDRNLLQRYNPGVNFSQGHGLVYIPAKDRTGIFLPLNTSAQGAGLSAGAIAGISIGAAGGVLLLVVCVYVAFRSMRKMKQKKLLAQDSNGRSAQVGGVLGSPEYESSVSTGRGGASSSSVAGITVDKSMVFSCDELARATDNFSMSHRIGQGGFGAVYYAELRGERAAIKKMDMQATREFLAELKVLTHVHHLNLVRLIGYSVEGSLFLVYEYMENGNLSEHLRGSGRDPLPWSTRVQIALDSARGLEYIHEHTVPVYIHRDIKSANILIDKNFHGKVADFGLTKLTEVGSSDPTRLVGTFGYMPPEYAQYGEVSPKIDIYAFGVVLYELISAKEAVVKTDETACESRGLVALFEGVLNKPDPQEELCKLVDPRLGNNYPIESVYKMAQLAKTCTQDNPDLRPSLRSIVVALMTLSSNSEEWEIGSYYENQTLINLMAGRYFASGSPSHGEECWDFSSHVYKNCNFERKMHSIPSSVSL